MSKSYIELPLVKLLKIAPHFYDLLPVPVDPSDKRYIVRIQGDRLEVGYPGDKWTIC